MPCRTVVGDGRCGRWKNRTSGMVRAMDKPVSKGAQTRERLLDIAEAAILEKGFSGTSIDELIAEAGLTKSGFFYHFSDKNDLARALMDRFIARDTAIFDEIFDRAAELQEDPLHAFLVAMKLTAEMMADLPGLHPGCLVATMTLHERQYDSEVRRKATQTYLGWRARFVGHLTAIAERYPPKVEIDLETLADMFTCVVDGGIIMSRGVNDPGVLTRQIMAYRTFVRAVFLGT